MSMKAQTKSHALQKRKRMHFLREKAGACEGGDFRGGEVVAVMRYDSVEEVGPDGQVAEDA